MKMKVAFKKATAIVLSVVMLAGCWVFCAPTAVADGDAASVGKYDVRVTVQVVNKGWFDSSNGYQGLNREEGASCGVSVVCKDANGTAEEGEEYAWDLGTGSDENYANNPGTYEFEVQQVGFPYIVGGYICGKWLSSEANTIKTIQIQKLEVKGSENRSTYVTLWEGVLQLSTKINGYGGYIENNGQATGWQNGIMNADNGKVGTDSNNYISDKSPWDMPYADNVDYYTSNTNCWGDALNIAENSTVFTPQTVACCVDQYGATVLEPYVAYDVTSYNGADQTENAQVDADFIQTAGDICFDQKTGRLFAGEEGYVAGRVKEHPLTTRTTFLFGGQSVSCTSDTVLVYPNRTVSWKYKLSTNELNSTEWGSVRDDSVLLGDTITDADYPGNAATRSYYTKGNHYSGGQFEDTKITEDTEVEMSAYTEQAHGSFVSIPIENDDVKHTNKCALCDYSYTQIHSFDAGSVTKEATCKEAGVFTKTCSACGYQFNTEIAKLPNHTWDNGVITKEPTCFENGIRTLTCSVCGDTQTKTVSMLTHNVELKTNVANGVNGSAYYECSYCHSYWATAYNSESGEFDFVDEEHPCDSLEDAISETGTNMPAPAFNVFNDTNIGYNYATRGASLRYGGFDGAPAKQPLRFTGSVKVPEGVSYQIGSDEQKVIVDAGYVFSQTECIGGDISNLVIDGGANIIQLSLAEKNAANGVFTGHNWGGLSAHEEADGTHLTFNIVIAVERYNWTEEYCVRPYITYKVGEMEVTLYDDVFSSRSVQQIAESVSKNTGESAKARAYCNQLLDIIQKEASL